jgi:hypothetical protein
MSRTRNLLLTTAGGVALIGTSLYCGSVNFSKAEEVSARLPTEVVRLESQIEAIENAGLDEVLTEQYLDLKTDLQHEYFLAQEPIPEIKAEAENFHQRGVYWMYGTIAGTLISGVSLMKLSNQRFKSLR